MSTPTPTRGRGRARRGNYRGNSKRVNNASSRPGGNPLNNNFNKGGVPYNVVIQIFKFWFHPTSGVNAILTQNYLKGLDLDPKASFTAPGHTMESFKLKATMPVNPTDPSRKYIYDELEASKKSELVLDYMNKRSTFEVEAAKELALFKDKVETKELQSLMTVLKEVMTFFKELGDSHLYNTMTATYNECIGSSNNLGKRRTLIHMRAHLQEKFFSKEREIVDQYYNWYRDYRCNDLCIDPEIILQGVMDRYHLATFVGCAIDEESVIDQCFNALPTHPNYTMIAMSVKESIRELKNQGGNGSNISLKLHTMDLNASGDGYQDEEEIEDLYSVDAYARSHGLDLYDISDVDIKEFLHTPKTNIKKESEDLPPPPRSRPPSNIVSLWESLSNNPSIKGMGRLTFNIISDTLKAQGPDSDSSTPGKSTTQETKLKTLPAIGQDSSGFTEEVMLQILFLFLDKESTIDDLSVRVFGQNYDEVAMLISNVGKFAPYLFSDTDKMMFQSCGSKSNAFKGVYMFGQLRTWIQSLRHQLEVETIKTTLTPTSNASYEFDLLRQELASLRTEVNKKGDDAISMHSMHSISFLIDKVALKTILIELQKVYRAGMKTTKDLAFNAAKEARRDRFNNTRNGNVNQVGKGQSCFNCNQSGEDKVSKEGGTTSTIPYDGHMSNDCKFEKRSWNDVKKGKPLVPKSGSGNVNTTTTAVESTTTNAAATATSSNVASRQQVNRSVAFGSASTITTTKHIQLNAESTNWIFGPQLIKNIQSVGTATILKLLFDGGADCHIWNGTVNEALGTGLFFNPTPVNVILRGFAGRELNCATSLTLRAVCVNANNTTSEICLQDFYVVPEAHNSIISQALMCNSPNSAYGATIQFGRSVIYKLNTKGERVVGGEEITLHDANKLQWLHCKPLEFRQSANVSH